MWAMRIQASALAMVFSQSFDRRRHRFSHAKVRSTILAFGNAERITRDVGFYYMANAAGRLIGTLLSGLSYQFGGLPLCLATAGVMAAASWIAARRLSSA
jgi:hypothetical protein